MLYLRHHPKVLRNIHRAETLLQEAYDLLLNPEFDDSADISVRRIFNRNGFELVEFKNGKIKEALEILNAGISRLKDRSDGIEKMHRTVLVYNRA